MKKTWLWTPGVLVALAGASYGIYVYLKPPSLQDGFVYGNGRIEGTEVQVSSEVTGRVLTSRLVEGTTVNAGEALVTLDSADLSVRVEQAQAEQEAAQREIPRLQSELRTAQHHLDSAQVDVERYRSLQLSSAVAAQRRDQAENALRDAQGQVAVLEERLTQAAAKVAAATNGVTLARSQLDKSSIRAPITGTVLVKNIQVGELLTPGRAVATLIDMTRMELKVYVPESEIGRIKLRDPARVRVDAYPDRYQDASVGRVDPKAQFTPRDVHMPDERVRLVFGVTLLLDNPDGQLKPGMPADAWIRWDPAVAWPSQLIVPRL